jgi:hypothetical protein
MARRLPLDPEPSAPVVTPATMSIDLAVLIFLITFVVEALSWIGKEALSDFVRLPPELPCLLPAVLTSLPRPVLYMYAHCCRRTVDQGAPCDEDGDSGPASGAGSDELPGRLCQVGQAAKEAGWTCGEHVCPRCVAGPWTASGAC